MEKVTKKETSGGNRTTPARKATKSRNQIITQNRPRNKFRHRIITLLFTLVYPLLALACIKVPVPVEQSGIIENTAVLELYEAPASGTPKEPQEPTLRYKLTEAERDLVERVVMAEAGGEPFKGQMLVAQCILNACEKTGTAPAEVVVAFRYTKARPEPTQSVKNAVTAVFDNGEEITTEPILYFYAPARTTSKWHESQRFVIEVGGHRFFAEKEPSK